MTVKKEDQQCILIERIITMIGYLSPEERVDIFYGCNGKFCSDCGKDLKEKPCPCWD